MEVTQKTYIAWPFAMIFVGVGIVLSSFALKFTPSIFGSSLIVLGAGTLLAFLVHLLANWAELQGTARVLFASLTSSVGLILASSLIHAMDLIGKKLQTLNGTDASGGAIITVFASNTHQNLFFLSILAIIVSYPTLLSELKAGERKDFLWLALPIIALLLSLLLGWQLPLFDAWMNA